MRSSFRSRPAHAARVLQTITGLAQGTTYTLQWWSEERVDTRALTAAVTAELERLDALLSNYRADSVLERFNATRINRAARACRPSSCPVFRARGGHPSPQRGLFRPERSALVRLWGFDGDDPHVPGDAEIASTLARVGLDKLEIVDNGHVRKARGDLEIDMASIGQGYTVGRISELVEALGLRDYLFEIGGELAGRGTRPDGKSWRVGIESPDKVDAPVRALSLPADRLTAVITSGSYRHNFTDHDRVYGHILDPRTGRSVDHDLVSVTVSWRCRGSHGGLGHRPALPRPDAGIRDRRSRADRRDIHLEDAGRLRGASEQRIQRGPGGRPTAPPYPRPAPKHRTTRRGSTAIPGV